MRSVVTTGAGIITDARQYICLCFLLCALCVLCGETRAQNFRTVHDGVEYGQVDHKLGSDPVKINLLRLDLTKVRIDVHHANDSALGLETTSSIARRKNVLAAINAGFFRLDRSEFAGEAAGVLMIDGVLLSESTNDRTGVFIENNKRFPAVYFNRIRAYADAHIGESNGFHHFDFSGINRERKDNEVLLFTPHFGASTRTGGGGGEIALSGCKFGKLRAGIRDIVCRRAERKGAAGNTVIPRDGFVISLGSQYAPPDEVVRSRLERLGGPNGRKIQLRLRNLLSVDGAGSASSGTVDVTNGVSRLIKDGKPELTWEAEKASRSFAETRHPRTAIAKLKESKLLLMTVDGRQPGVSVGMTLQELAEYLLSLGAIDAMNLDGGGSTTMVLDGKVVNTPSDREGERKVGDAILVTPRKGSRSGK